MQSPTNLVFKFLQVEGRNTGARLEEDRLGVRPRRDGRTQYVFVNIHCIPNIDTLHTLLSKHGFRSIQIGTRGDSQRTGHFILDVTLKARTVRHKLTKLLLQILPLLLIALIPMPGSLSHAALGGCLAVAHLAWLAGLDF